MSPKNPQISNHMHFLLPMPEVCGFFSNVSFVNGLNVWYKVYGLYMQAQDILVIIVIFYFMT